MRLIIVAMALLPVLISGCANTKGAMRLLQGQGYTDIKTHGADFAACRDDEWINTKFTALDRKGKPVTGWVCQNPLTGKQAVRFKKEKP